MIGSISGKLIEKSQGVFLIDVSGVGYEVIVPTQVFESFSLETVVKLRTHLHVREDALILFGFERLEQLRLFELLIGVSGVGPKMALSVVSAYSVDEITEAVSKASPELFQSISGIGKKNAQRIIVDLQPKLGILAELDFERGDVPTDLVEALVNFGYAAREVREVLKQVETSLSEDEKLKEALKRLGAKR